MSDKDIDGKDVIFLVSFVLAIVFIIPSCLLNAQCMSVLWDWFFVVPYGLPKLELFNALGIYIFIGLLWKRRSSSYKGELDYSKFYWGVYLTWWLYPLTLLLFGFIVKQLT